MRALYNYLSVILLLFLATASFGADTQKADAVLVVKSEKRLYLIN